MFPNLNKTWKPGSSQFWLPVLSRDREEDVPKCSGQEISRIFSGKICFPGNGIRECRPLHSCVTLKIHSCHYVFNFNIQKLPKVCCNYNSVIIFLMSHRSIFSGTMSYISHLVAYYIHRRLSRCKQLGG